LLYGSWEAFNNPQSIIISEQMAQRFFGNENALGKQITVCSEGFDSEVITVYTVGAVTRNRPQSAVIFDGLICDSDNNWGGPTLLMMPPNTNLSQFETKVKTDKTPTLSEGQYYFHTFNHAISSTYSQQELTYWHYRKNNLLMVGLISAILVFLIAIFNYVNMSFSRILQQVKTLHSQKLMGAKPTDVRWQIFLDTFLTVFISFVLAMLMMHDLLPVFNQIVAVDFSSKYFYSKDFFPLLIVLIFLLTVIPALLMSRKISRLSGSDYRMFFITRKNRWVGTLAAVQFVITICLIIATITVNRQVALTINSGKHFRNLISIGSAQSKANLKNFDKTLMSVPGVANVSRGNLNIMYPWIIYGTLKQKDATEFQTTVLRISGDEGLIKTLQLHQLTGEVWETVPDKYPNSVFINKTFADLVAESPENIIGQPLIKYFEADYASEWLKILIISRWKTKMCRLSLSA
jgi:hypothetical protein